MSSVVSRLASAPASVCLDLSSKLYTELNHEKFEKLFQKLFRKSFALLFRLLFDLKYRQLWLSLYLVLCRQTLLGRRPLGRPLGGRIVSRTDRRYYIWYLALTQDSARETGTVPSQGPVRRGQTRGESDAAAPCACPLGGTVPASRKPRNKTPGRSTRNDGPRRVADDRWNHCHRCVRGDARPCGASNSGGKPPSNPESNGQSYLRSNEERNRRS